MHIVRLGTRFGFLTGTALALILTVSITASAVPQNSNQMQLPHPVVRDYSTPGSMPEPSTTMDDGIRFRGTLPASSSTPTPLAPASIELRGEPAKPVATAKPVTAPEPVRAEAEPEAVVASPEPVAKFTPAPAPVSRPIAVPVPAPEPAPRPVAAPAPAPESVARSVVAPVARPGSVPPRPVAVEAPAANAATEAEVGNKLREIITGKQFDRLVARKPDRDAIVALYQKVRYFQPLWVAQGAASKRAKDVIEYLGTIDADGLDPKDYRMPKLNVGSAEEQAQSELKFTETLLTYSRHAMTGRVHFSRVSPNIDYKLAFDADDVLKGIAASNELGKTLAQFNPPQPGYRALKAKLAEMRDALDEPVSSRVENGPVLRYTRDSRGKETVMADPRVSLLRERLGLAAEPNSNYNAALAMAVGKFQKTNGIQVTGQLNGPTIEAINGPSRVKKLDAVLATMERWRWMPRDLGKTHVELNIPDYFVRVYNNGEKVWQTRTVVGKPGHETPLLTETMKFITVNPTWNVPESIIYNELLPVYETSDPQIFERQGLKMERTADGKIRVFQPPGERNALGQIRFNFPNKFLVYQHDTPEKNYFNHDKRAYSHGCQRVQDPLKYAEVLLSYASPKANYTAEGIKRMLGGE